MKNQLSLLAALTAVPVLAPAPTATLHDLGRPGSAPLVALVGLGAWLCGGWLLLVLGLSVLEQRRGRTGRAAHALLARLAPRPVRLAARLLLGTTLITGSLGSAAASATSSGHGPAPAAAAPSLDWPAGPPVPALDWPTVPAPSSTASPATGTATGGNGVVVVQPGDCLWSLAERALGSTATPARTAASWPAWWSANRAVIGSDPDLLQPGTRLVPPA